MPLCPSLILTRIPNSKLSLVSRPKQSTQCLRRKLRSVVKSFSIKCILKKRRHKSGERLSLRSKSLRIYSAMAEMRMRKMMSKWLFSQKNWRKKRLKSHLKDLQAFTHEVLRQAWVPFRGQVPYRVSLHCPAEAARDQNIEATTPWARMS